jgi:hypothetical protein
MVILLPSNTRQAIEQLQCTSKITIQMILNIYGKPTDVPHIISSTEINILRDMSPKQGYKQLL